MNGDTGEEIPPTITPTADQTPTKPTPLSQAGGGIEHLCNFCHRSYSGKPKLCPYCAKVQG